MALQEIWGLPIVLEQLRVWVLVCEDVNYSLPMKSDITRFHWCHWHPQSHVGLAKCCVHLVVCFIWITFIKHFLGMWALRWCNSLPVFKPMLQWLINRTKWWGELSCLHCCWHKIFWYPLAHNDTCCWSHLPLVASSSHHSKNGQNLQEDSICILYEYVYVLYISCK